MADTTSDGRGSGRSGRPHPSGEGQSEQPLRTFGSLFAGIGGIDLGLERAGWTGRWQVEYEPFCQRVLAKHWPDVPRAGDIRDTHAVWDCPVADAEGWRWDGTPTPEAREHQGEREGPPGGRRCASCLTPVDLIAGGFPCQPFSVAGKRLGKADERWLWPEFARTIRALRPRYVLVENVPGLLAGHGGMGAVLGDLAELGYDAEWDSIPAAAVGAPHLRYRVWIVAYAQGSGWSGSGAGDQAGDPVAGRDGRAELAGGGATRRAERVAHPAGLFDPEEWSRSLERPAGSRGDGDGWGESEPGLGGAPDGLSAGLDGAWGPGWEDGTPRVARGVPDRVNRLRALGNAVVPQVVEAIGRRILEAEGLT